MLEPTLVTLWEKMDHHQVLPGMVAVADGTLIGAECTSLDVCGTTVSCLGCQGIDFVHSTGNVGQGSAFPHT